MYTGPRHRLPRLILLLAAGPPTLAELCVALDAGARTIQQDLQALEEGGILLERHQSSGGDRPGRQPTRYQLAAETRLRLGR